MTTKTATPEIVSTAPVMIDEVEAAELEGLAQVDTDSLARVRRYERLAARKAEIEAEMKTIRDEFDTKLSARGLRGFVYRGKNLVLRTLVTTPRVDVKELKVKYPTIADELTKVTTSVRVTIN
jgi:predicted phage-related endonuclease